MSTIQIYSVRDGDKVGRISKKWTGFISEFVSDADNFGVQFPTECSLDMKCALIGATILIVKIEMIFDFARRYITTRLRLILFFIGFYVLWIRIGRRQDTKCSECSLKSKRTLKRYKIWRSRIVPCCFLSKFRELLINHTATHKKLFNYCIHFQCSN